METDKLQVELPQEPFIIATEAQIQATFTEWDKRFRENPEQFISEAQDANTYGEAVTPYFLSILEEIAKQ